MLSLYAIDHRDDQSFQLFQNGFENSPHPASIAFGFETIPLPHRGEGFGTASI
jgi:hypothetical protein